MTRRGRPPLSPAEREARLQARRAARSENERRQRSEASRMAAAAGAAILGPAPPKRGRPPGPVLRPLTEAELARNKAAGAAAAPKLRRPSTRPRTVDAAWGKAMSRAAQMVRTYAAARDGEGDLDDLAEMIEAEPAPPSETR